MGFTPREGSIPSSGTFNFPLCSSAPRVGESESMRNKGVGASRSNLAARSTGRHRMMASRHSSATNQTACGWSQARSCWRRDWASAPNGAGPRTSPFAGGRAVNSFTQIEREYATFVTIVGRVARGPWGSIDVDGRAGVVRQQVTLTVGGSQGANGITSQTSETSHALSAVTAGADATMRVVDHLGVGTLVRLTGTNRPTGFVRAYSLGLFVRAWW